MFEDIAAYFQGERLMTLVRAIATLVIGLILARLAAAAVSRILTRRGSPQQALLGRRVVFATIAGLVVVSALNQFGVDLSVLLGAAGILTVAIGFASQTSASNVISGAFLLAERPFVLGDVVQIGTTQGEVVAIDLLSVKLRTWDNRFVRIPNENLLKSEIENLTHFPIRRLDVPIGVHYDTDLAAVQAAIDELTEANPLIFDEPKPRFVMLDFGDNALMCRLSVWAHRDTFFELGWTLRFDIVETFRRHGVTIPYPQRTLSLDPKLDDELSERWKAKPAKKSGAA